MTRPDQFSEGADTFRSATALARNEDERMALENLINWAEGLEGHGWAELRTMTGDARRWALHVRVPGESNSLVKIWNEKGLASIQLHNEPFKRVAPQCLALLQRLGVSLPNPFWNDLRSWTKLQLAVLRGAFAEAVLTQSEFAPVHDELMQQVQPAAKRDSTLCSGSWCGALPGVHRRARRAAALRTASRVK